MAQIYDSSHSGQEIDAAVDAVQTTIPSQLAQIGSKIGDLNNLQTTEKSNLVGAVNEVKNNAGGTYNLIANNHSTAMSLATALQHIPTDKYQVGMHIIFNQTDEGVVEYQFVGTSTSSITDASFWRQILVTNYSRTIIADVLSNKGSSIGAFITDANVWQARNGQYAYMVDISSYAGKTLEITAVLSSNYASTFAFLTSNSHTNGATPDFDTTINNGRLTLNAGESAEFVIPSTSKYFYFNGKYQSTIFEPSEIKIVEYSGDPYLKTSEVEAMLAADNIGTNSASLPSPSLTNIQATLDYYSNKLFGADLMEDAEVIDYIINNKNKWYKGLGYSGSLVSVDGISYIRIKANADITSYYAFLTDRTITSGATPNFATGYTGRVGLNADTSILLEVPQDAAYLYYGNGSASQGEISIPQEVVNTEEPKTQTTDTEFSKVSMVGLETDIIATTRNYILKFYTENGTNYLKHSDNLGKTWTTIEWPDDEIMFVHWFVDGTCLIASRSHCYYTKDFTSLTQSVVYDVDGNEFVPNSYHFYKWGNYNSEFHKFNGTEAVFWNDYNGGASGYHSRVWMSTDNGHTIRCICKSGTTKDTDNNTISVRHFHQLWFNDNTQTLWITAGDSAAQCMLLKATYVDGEWQFERVASGTAFKYGQIYANDNYLYLVTDITFTGEDTGIVMCPVGGVSDSGNYKYLYTITDLYPESNPSSEYYNKPYPITCYFEDKFGNRIIMPDGIGYNVMWYARGDMNFRKIQIQYDSNLSFQCVWGANYNGDCVITGVTGYSIANTRSMSQPKRFLLTDAMRNAGIEDFNKQDYLFK